MRLYKKRFNMSLGSMGMGPWAPPDFSESRKLLGFYEKVT